MPRGVVQYWIPFIDEVSVFLKMHFKIGNSLQSAVTWGKNKNKESFATVSEV